MKLILLIVLAWIAVPVLVSCARYSRRTIVERRATAVVRPGAGPEVHREAVVQIYNARAFAWRGIFATHPWIVVKRADADCLQAGRGRGMGLGSKLRTDYAHRRRPLVRIDAVVAGRCCAGRRRKRDRPDRSAVASYPSRTTADLAGPNSDTFLAHVAREVPELSLDIPASAIGKDYRPWTSPPVRAQRTGLQVSLLGLPARRWRPRKASESTCWACPSGSTCCARPCRLPAIGRLGVPEDVSRSTRP